MNIFQLIISQLRKHFIEQEYRSVDTGALRDFVCVVTGSGRGVGKSVATALFAHGATVVGLTRTATEKPDSGRTYTELVCDVSDEQSVIRTIDSIVSTYGKIDVLINNAGLFSSGLLEKTTAHDFDSIVRVNMKGVYLVTRAVVPVMKRKKTGTIITIGSKISHNSKMESGKTLYAMTKYAVEGFSYALHRELQKTGVRSICLLPGTIHTFVSKKASTYLSPYDIGEIIRMIISMPHIDFESMVFKSHQQDI